MRTPKRISDLLDIRSQWLDAAQGKLDSKILSYQQRLLDKILQEVIPALEVDASGNIKENLANIRLLQTLEKVIKDFTRDNKYVLGADIAKSMDKIATLGNKYFIESLGDELSAMFPKIIADTKKLIDLRLGIKGGKIVAGEFLDKVITSDELMTTIKQYLSKAITGKMPRKQLLKELTAMVTGAGLKQGGYQRNFSRFAHDLYLQYDAAYNKTIADRLGMTWFIYQGNLIKDSRDFCVAKRGKVYNAEDAAEWDKWTPAKGIAAGEFPATVNGKPFVIPDSLKAKNQLNKVPSYIGYEGYSALIDRGGYNCRHILGWISDGLAERMKAKEPKKPEEQKGFVPAKTMKEAEEYAKRFSEEVSYTNYGEMDLDAANSVNKTLTELYDKYKFGKLTSIRDLPIDNLVADYKEYQIKVGSSDGIRAMFGKNLDRVDEHTGFYFDDAIEAGIRHEMGHLLPRDVYDEVIKLFSDMIAYDKYKDRYGISARAKDNIFECMAENFVLFSAGMEDKIHPALLKVLKKLER